MYRKTHLAKRTVREVLSLNPTITTLDELLAVKAIRREDVPQEDLDFASMLIERNRLRQQVMLKQELYRKTDNKSKEMLYKMICDAEELKRFGIQSKEVGKNMTIQIKSADPDILDKLKEL